MLQSLEIHDLSIARGGMNLYGRLYLPKNSGKEMPLVILSHGFGGTYRNVESYAQAFAKNDIAAFAYDFIGGGNGSRSGGSTSAMSVLTEADDLSRVLDYFLSDANINNRQVYLLGESQGGFVSAYVAGKRPEDVAGLILLYPAFVLQDDSRQRNPDPENGPAQTNMWGVQIGRIYDVDAQSFDIYDVIKSYSGKALIIHGTGDSIVPIAYSERAAKAFPDAKLIKLIGAGHGFYGREERTAQRLSLQFLKNA